MIPTEAIDANPQVAAIARATPKIVGGEPVDIADRPWQVALVRGLDPEPKRSQFCGASVIDPGWVLTAAHCVRNTLVREDPSRVNVVVGTSQFFLGGERIPVTAIHIHPKYVDQTHDFDFALLRLTRSVTMGAGAVTKPIDLADANAQFPDGTKAFVSGWGAVSEGRAGLVGFAWRRIPIVSNDVCNKPESYGRADWRGQLWRRLCTQAQIRSVCSRARGSRLDHDYDEEVALSPAASRHPAGRHTGTVVPHHARCPVP